MFTIKKVNERVILVKTDSITIPVIYFKLRAKESKFMALTIENSASKKLIPQRIKQF